MNSVEAYEIRFAEDPTLMRLIERGFAPVNGQTDILLIFPPTSIASRYGKESLGKLGGDLIPLGIASIAAFLRENGYGVGVLDCCALGLNQTDVVSIIKKIDPRIIGLSSTTYAFPSSVELAKNIRQTFPNKLILLGGSHANVAGPETAKQYSDFDIIVSGLDGEYTALEIVSEYAKIGYDHNKFCSAYQVLREIRGICFRQSDEVIETPLREVIAELDDLPFPARDLFPLERYKPLPNQYKKLPLTNMVVIRGCPYVCSFCDQAGTGARRRSPELTVAEIKHVVEEYGVREISFWDDTMSYHKRWMTEFCNLLTEENLDVIWSCYAAVNTVNESVLKEMKKAGCWNIFYGFETGVPSLLRNIEANKKNKSFEKMKEVTRWTKEAGIEIRGSFMIGLPGETPELARETIRYAIDLDPEYAQFSITTPYPGTKLFHDINNGKWGKLTTKDFSEYQGWNVVFLPDGYKNKSEVWGMEREAFRSFYMRPRYIIKKLLAIRTWEDVKRYYKGAVALLGGFAFGPMPEHIRVKTGRTP